MEIHRLAERQRAYFRSGQTRQLAFRIEMLRKLYDAVKQYQPQLTQALREDLGKAPQEGYMAEIGLVLEELRYLIRHLPGWVRPVRVQTPLAQFPSKSFVLREPYGVALIMAPWNYPVQLCLVPLAGALCAGNCAVLKPSAYAPSTAAVLQKMLGEIFPPAYVAVVTGGRKENTDLLAQEFDDIFFTGSVEVGKEVMAAAAAHLTPVTLELGGKSPCIVEKTARLEMTARRIVFGKLLNAGQTCVAPDYLLVERPVKDRLLALMAGELKRMLGDAPCDNPEYPRIVNQKHFERLCGLLEGTSIYCGGKTDPARLKIEPTLLDGCDFDSPVMREEIFGPILPVIAFDDLSGALNEIIRRPKPLALYLFTSDRAVEQKVLRQVSFGGGCVGDTVVHLATSHMGFGGVGASGMGAYHGKKSFEAFSHEKSVLKKSMRIDLPMRYHPYSESRERWIRRFLK